MSVGYQVLNLFLTGIDSVLLLIGIHKTWDEFCSNVPHVKILYQHPLTAAIGEFI
jgi:hypothetical protein